MEILVISYPVYKYVCTSDGVVNVHVRVFHNSYFQYSRTSLLPARYNLNERENNITETFGKCVRLRRFSLRSHVVRGDKILLVRQKWLWKRDIFGGKKWNGQYSRPSLVNRLFISRSLQRSARVQLSHRTRIFQKPN